MSEGEAVEMLEGFARLEEEALFPVGKLCYFLGEDPTGVFVVGAGHVEEVLRGEERLIVRIRDVGYTGFLREDGSRAETALDVSGCVPAEPLRIFPGLNCVGEALAWLGRLDEEHFRDEAEIVVDSIRITQRVGGVMGQEVERERFRRMAENAKAKRQRYAKFLPHVRGR